MPRIRIREWHGGLHLSGAREDSPPGTLRRARGLHQVRTRSARSRAGSTKLYDLTAHSLFRFDGHRFAGVGIDLFRDGASLGVALSGTRLAFVAIPPTAGKSDALFVSGGGRLIKVIGSTVTDWGISPPPDGFTAAPIAQQTKAIDTFNGEAASFTLTPGSDTDGTPGAGKSDEAALTVSGGSLQIAIGPGKHVAYQRTFGAPISLKVFASGDPSPDEDYIELWVHCGNPHRIEQVTCDFFVGETPDGSGRINNLFTKDILVEDQVTKKQVQRERGLGDLIQVTDQDAAFKALAHTNPSMLSTQETLGTTKLVATRHTWTRLRLPKSTFHRAGNGTAGWEDIRGIRVGVRTNSFGPLPAACTNVYFDSCTLVGSVGMQGDYQWRVTFLNKNTGTRSNPNPTPVTLTGLVRQGATLSGLPVSADPQVTHLEVWRSLGNGAVLFKAAELTNGTTTFTDKVADYIGLFGNTTNVLEDEVLLFDNIKPDAGFLDAVGPHYGRVFWTKGGDGRIYYSAPDRAEVQVGFIVLTDTDDQPQKLLRWNDALWCLTTNGLYSILNTTEPFLAQKMLDVPGTTQPFAAVATPQGIFYQATDGLRRFDGAGSSLVRPDALGVLYRGEASENLPAFAGVVAAYGNDEYVVGGNGIALAYNLTDDTFRELGLACYALFFEEDTGLMTATVGSKILVLDDPAATTDDGVPIAFSIQHPAVVPPAGQQALVQRVYIECRANGQLLTPTLLLDDTEVPLPPLIGDGQRVFDYAVLRAGRVMSLRLEGQLSAPVEVVGCEYDTYIAGEAPPE